jgi:crotonobetainyl-CoA:carnitine CoA-transferase CaiB-like acyl-CoA transferase
VGYDHPHVGFLEQVGHLIECSHTPGRIRAPAPMVGQPTREILRELKYEGDEIANLLEEGVVAEWP